MQLKTIQVMLKTNLNPFRAEMAQAGAAVKGFGQIADEADGKVNNVGKGFSAGKVIAAGLAVALIAFAAIVGKTIEFDANMRNVNSISKLSEKALSDLGGEVIKLSTRLPQSAKDLSAGLYDIASSGFHAEAGLKVLTASGEAAAAGLTTTATAGKAITGVLNAYGLGAESAGRVSDALFQTVNLGVVTFEELAGTIGDVVGITSAAGISIEEVGAALATMTLSGIGAAEAGTSLARLTQSLIQPSDELAATYRKLGINIVEDLKNPAIGLNGVMVQLRESTGGNLTALLQLFPEIRAARGALALMSAEGRNAKEVWDAMGTAEKNVGATKAALTEQMKGLGMQLQLLKNQGMAWVTSLGMELIPKVLAFIDLMKSDKLANSAIGALFKDLVSIGGNVAQVLGHLVTAGAPLLKFFLELAAVPIVGTLKLVASALESLTGFLADHKGLVIALGAAYASTLIPGLAKAALEFGVIAAAQARIVVGGTIQWVKDLATGFTTAATAAGGYGKALIPLAGGVVMAGAVAAIALVANAWMEAGKTARDYVEEVKKGFDDSGTLDAYKNNISTLEQEYNKAADAARNHKNETSLLNDIFGGGLGVQMDNIRTAKELRAAHDELQTAMNNTAGNYHLISDAAGISESAVEAFNLKIGADFTGSIESSGPARERFIATIKEMATTAGVTGEELVKMTNNPAIDPAKLAAAFEAMAEAGNKARESFRSASDVVSEFGSSLDVTAGKIQQFYADQVRQGQNFASNVEKALTQGLNPAVIQRALEQGPKAAAAFIEAVVADNTGKTIRIVNDGETALGQIEGKLGSLAQQAAAAQAGLGDLGGVVATPTINANDADFVIKTGSAGIRLKDLGGDVATPSINADAAGLNAQVVASHGYLSGVQDHTVTPAINGNPADLIAKANQSHAALTGVQGHTATPNINANPADLTAKVSRSHSDLSGVQGHTATPNINANANDLNAKVNQSNSGLGGLHNRFTSPTINATNSGAMGAINSVLGGLGRIVSRTWTAVIRSVFQQEDGGYFPGVTAFAGGSEDHRAQIATAGSMRLWAEPETGGEAYIPLANAKRGPSTTILRMVASDFGYELVPQQAQRMHSGGFVRQIADAGGRGGTTREMESLRSELRELSASIRGSAQSSGNVTIENFNVRGIVDFTRPDVATRQIIVALDAALEGVRRK